MENLAVRIVKRHCSEKVQAYINVGDIWFLKKDGKDSIFVYKKGEKPKKLSRSRFEWEYITSVDILSKSSVKYEKKDDIRSRLDALDRGRDVRSRYLIPKAVLCEYIAVEKVKEFCNVAAIEKCSMLVKLCRVCRKTVEEYNRGMRTIPTHPDTQRQMYMVGAYAIHSYQLWNLCNVSIKNALNGGYEATRTAAMIAWFWTDLARRLWGEAARLVDGLPQVPLTKQIDSLGRLMEAAIGEGVEMPDFEVMRGCYVNVLTKVVV